ncbi:MAG TPA: Hsp20/alpha crystallin family protein [candidate division WOR-3 bacterium]|uniref:Hsp20/alpha crystallin family protein n=1 Tax=candidate division WOR-3 bacterium TaxID=2052148 RepID=A0A9C9ENL3_UNCW3|nr:Hsp20/alpha crystallin family protein [candidate division WOR-3 bacterium]
MADKFLDKWEPFRDMLNLRADMDRFFKSFFSGFPEEKEGFWSPVIDIEEDNENYIVKAELPGMKKEDIKVTVRDNVLSISGERKQEKETKDKTFHRIERSYGKFSRTISLPSTVDSNKIKATYKDGVLNITLPKLEEEKPRQIDVEIK